MARPFLVAVAGLMGAGKTTVARGLASSLGWLYVPESRPATVLLGDLFGHPSRWAFETQTAFLVSKALQLKEALSKGGGTVLDRTLDEDVEVFAEYFRRRGHIDERSYGTYRALADHFLGDLPAPDLVVLCQCPVELAERRVGSRPDNLAGLYPPQHMEEIAALYEEWSKRYDTSDLYVLDTVKFDTRRTKVIEQLSREVTAALETRGYPPPQLDMFLPSAPGPDQSPRLLGALRLVPEEGYSRLVVRPPLLGTRVTKYPSAYIAAPFTDYTSDRVPSAELFEPSNVHGVLEAGDYRSFLLAIERALRKLGISSLIPHRDVNEWGERQLSSSQVVRLCSDYVRETDLFVGVLGLSQGSHYEFGLACGLGKPALIIRVESIPESFVARGAADSPADLRVMSLATLAEVEQALLHPDTVTFLRRFIPLHGGATR